MRADKSTLLLGVLLLVPLVAAAQHSDYYVGPSDVLTVTVWNQPTLSGPFTVESDGTFVYPLLGQVRASGRTVREIESDLTNRLAAGFVKQPQVRVSVEQHESQRVLVMGEVRTPGSYTLTREMTLAEALALAGSMTARAGEEVLVLRGGSDGSLPGSEDVPEGDIERVSLDATAGVFLAQRVRLAAGDLVFVPAAPTVHVFGEVRNPGEYPLRRGTRVLQALALAGGLTDRGSKRDVRIVRDVGGKTVELKATLDDVVQGGDVIVVRERFF